MYGSIITQQRADAVLTSLFIHTFIQIAFLWPVLKPLTCLTQISARYYMSHILISLNVSSRMSYLEKLFSIVQNFYILQNYAQCSCITFSIMLISHLKNVPVTDKCVKYFYASIQVYIVSVHIHIKTKFRHVHVLYIRSC